MSTSLSRPMIKICGQTQQEPIDLALAHGVDALGFIFHEKSPRAITPHDAAQLHTGAAQRVGVFVKQDARATLAIMEEAKLDLAQLHGAQDLETATAIGAQRVIRVIWPERYTSISELQCEINRWAHHCAYYLVDAGKEGGGHGATLSASELLEEAKFPHPWLLAGGLTPENAVMLQKKFTPDGLDLNSGLENESGRKSHRKIIRLFNNLLYLTKKKR